jgi:3-oxoacyl-[acyl-carrier protein] reductase
VDLGIQGKVAVVLGSSQGLGYACAKALAREGVHVWLNGRDEKKLALAAVTLSEELLSDNEQLVSAKRALPLVPKVSFVAGDLTTVEGRKAIQVACAEPDILVTNNAGPPPGKLEDWTPEVWAAALQSNLLGHVFLIQGYVRGMQARRFGRIVNITSAMVKAPRSHQGLSTTARAGLTAFSKALALDVAKDNVTINNLLPERIDTPRQQQLTERLMASEGLDFAAARKKLEATIAAKRFGTPEEFGDACAFLCSVQASYISGQNLQIDGGSFPGLM